jgi:hypothetical protein
MEPAPGIPKLASASLNPDPKWWNASLMRDDKVIEQPTDLSTLTRCYTEEALRFIQENKKKPFFLYFAHTYPHVPLFASQKFKNTSARGLYGDVVEELDWSVGQVLDTIARFWRVLPDAEVTLDEPRDAGGGPELVVPAVVLGPQRQQLFELAQLVVGQAGGGSGMGLGVQAVGLSGQAEPAGQGLGVSAEDAGDVGARLPLRHQLDGTAAAAFQFSSSSKGSTHTELDAPARQREL